MESSKGKEHGSEKRKKGLWGGNAGSSWDDGIYDGVREIMLAYEDVINSIRVVYDKKGEPVTEEKHGGPGGYWTAEIKLQYPEEFLIGVSGHYGSFALCRYPVIRSLAFISNQRTYGPYGADEEGTPFTSETKGVRIVGFHGRSGLCLDAIGIHLSPTQTKNLSPRPSPP